MSFSFSQENLDSYTTMLPRYPHKKALLLPCLWMGQYQEGYLSKEVMLYLAELLDLPLAHIYAVASFYTMFNLEKVPAFHIQVCKTLSCELCGKNEIIESIEEETGLKVGEENALFKLSEVECLGACGGAPMLAMNEEYHENLTPIKMKELLQRLAK